MGVAIAEKGLPIVGQDPLQDLAELKYQTTKTSLNVLGISTTNMNLQSPRTSTSELALERALAHAETQYGAKTKLLKLRELNFRHCEGYYSRSEQACTWPCTISDLDPNDGMNAVYRNMILWADVVLVATPIRWGAASSLYYKMTERLNCVQNQLTLYDRALVKNKVVGFVITGGQDNIQAVAGQMMCFFTLLGFAIPPFSITGWTRGWIAEDTEENVRKFVKSRYITRSTKELVANCVTLLRQIKGDPAKDVGKPLPRISESPSQAKTE